MLVFLRVEAGPHAGRRIDLRSGQVAVFGATEEADFCFERDPEMAAAQFRLTVTAQACEFHQLDGEALTRINQEDCEHAILRTGDVITAGQSRFSIRLDGQQVPEAVTDPQSDVVDAAPEEPGSEAVVEVCRYLKLSDAAIDMAADCERPEQLVDQLEESENFAEAVRLQVHLLPVPLAVQWAIAVVNEQVGETLPPNQQRALQAAAQWAKDPSEPLRREAESQAESLEYRGIGATLAAAVFFSGGNIGPDDLEQEVEADPRSSGQAITVALDQAAMAGGRKAAPERYRLILQRSRELVT